MKSLISLLLMLMMLFAAAQAETLLIDGYADAPDEAALTDHLAEALSAALSETVTARHEADVTAAVNAFLAEKGDAALVCVPDAYIVSLQGYTSEDLRDALLPVTRVAQSASVMMLSRAAMDAVGEPTAEGLAAWTEEHEYELFLARLIDAGHNDYLSLTATGELYVDQNLYMDWAEAAQAAEDGAADLTVLSAAMQPEEIAGIYTPVYTTELPGLWQGLFVRTGREDLAERLNAALPGICGTDAYRALLAAGHYEDVPCPEQKVFAEEVRQLVADYVRYLTNEGLFFYEE